MDCERNDLFSAAQGALHELDRAGAQIANVPARSPEFGTAQIALARATAFEDAMLAAVRSRLSELKSVAK